MKKVIVPAIALLVGSGALHAQAKNEFKYGMKEISVTSFEGIRVNANVQVVLAPAKTAGKVFIEGDEKTLNIITVSIENGELVINPAKNCTGKTNLLVTIPVDNVKPIVIKGEAKVESIAAL
jgi:hypothetical protein